MNRMGGRVYNKLYAYAYTGIKQNKQDSFIYHVILY